MYIGIPNIIHEYPHKTTISNGCAMSASFQPSDLVGLGFPRHPSYLGSGAAWQNVEMFPSGCGSKWKTINGTTDVNV